MSLDANWVGAIGQVASATATFLAVGIALSEGYRARRHTRQMIEQQFELQNEKEGNIRRKNELYEPLYSEIKYAYHWLVFINNGEMYYPNHFYFLTGDLGNRPNKRNEDYLTILTWEEFGRGHSQSEFSPMMRVSMDVLTEDMRQYNLSIEEAKSAVVRVMIPIVERYVKIYMASLSYVVWSEKLLKSGMQATDEKFDKWNRRLYDRLQVDGSTILDIAEPMSKDLGGSGIRTRAFFWLLTGDKGEMIKAINKDYEYIESVQAPIPDLWFENIIRDAWPQINKLDEVEKVRKFGKNIYQEIGNIERKLEAAMNSIRDKYEGGTPLV